MGHITTHKLFSSECISISLDGGLDFMMEEAVKTTGTLWNSSQDSKSYNELI